MDGNTELTLVYPAHVLDPESLLIFIESSWFMKDWKSLGLDVEVDLACLQMSIMCDPRSGEIVRGTGGLRKMRFSPPGWDKGKSGALRICYCYYEEFGNVLLLLVYPKNVKDDLSSAERKAAKQIIDSHQSLLTKHYYT